MKNIDNFKYKTKDYFCGYLRNGLTLKFYNQTEVTKELPIGCLLPFISLPLPAATTATAHSGPACKPVGRPAGWPKRASSKQN